VPIVLKSGSLNLLEPSGPAQACTGIALPLLVLVCLRLTITVWSFCLTKANDCGSGPSISPRRTPTSLVLHTDMSEMLHPCNTLSANRKSAISMCLHSSVVLSLEHLCAPLPLSVSFQNHFSRFFLISYAFHRKHRDIL